MPARKRQQAYRRRRQRSSASQTRPSGDGALDQAARELAATHSVAELQTLVAAAQEACNQADSEAQQQPSSAALRRYRSAATALDEAQRALALATRPGAD